MMKNYNNKLTSPPLIRPRAKFIKHFNGNCYKKLDRFYKQKDNHFGN